jgi:hypothetical protein
MIEHNGLCIETTYPEINAGQEHSAEALLNEANFLAKAVLGDEYGDVSPEPSITLKPISFVAAIGSRPESLFTLVYVIIAAEPETGQDPKKVELIGYTDLSETGERKAYLQTTNASCKAYEVSKDLYNELYHLAVANAIQGN